MVSGTVLRSALNIIEDEAEARCYAREIKRGRGVRRVWIIEKKIEILGREEII